MTPLWMLLLTAAIFTIGSGLGLWLVWQTVTGKSKPDAVLVVIPLILVMTIQVWAGVTERLHI